MKQHSEMDIESHRLGLHDLHPDDARKIHRGEMELEPVEVAETAGDTWGRACRDAQ